MAKTKSPSRANSQRTIDPINSFHRLAENWLRETCERFPEYASDLGFEKFEDRLGANRPADHIAQNKLCAATLSAMEALPGSAFRGDDYLDRRGFIAMLRTHEVLDDRLERWRTDPQRHINTATQSIFSLVIKNPTRLKQMLPKIEARLDALPEFLRAGTACVRYPVPLWTQLAVEACDGAEEFLREIEPELVAVSPDQPATKSLLESAVAAIRKYAGSIQRKSPGPENGFAIGRWTFEELLRERLGVDLSLPEIEAEGRAMVQSIQEEITAEAKRTGFPDVESALAAGVDSWQPDRPLIELYRDVTTTIRDRVDALGLVTMPTGESLDVLPVPAFLRHQFPTAAYSAPPPFSKKQRGIFWVNDLSLTVENPAKKLAEIRQHFGLELTAAHEAYPGHHLQFAIQNRHPSKWRRLFAHAIFYEGWTLWCEKMCVDEGLVDVPGVRIRQLHDALWRAYRILIDCGLQSGSMTYDAACRLLMRGVGFTRARAEADVNWYSSSPTVPMSYLLGRLEVERLHAHFVIKENWTLRQFNDWMLSHGAIPWRWILDARLRP